MAVSAIDWTRSRAHVALLKCFQTPTIVPHHVVADGRWPVVLGESVVSAVGRLLRGGALAPLVGVDALLQFTGADLKAALREADLPVSGRKIALAERLLTQAPAAAARLISARCYFCSTPEALPVTADFDAELCGFKRATVSKMLAAIAAGRPDQVVKALGAYQAHMVPPQVLRPDEWSIALVGDIARCSPAILDGAGPEDMQWYRLGATVCHLLGVSTVAASAWTPSGLGGVGAITAETCCRMVLFAATHRRNLASAVAASARLGLARKYRVSCAQDAVSCAACKRLGDMPAVSADALPELPSPSCNSTAGCRCTFLRVRERQ